MTKTSGALQNLSTVAVLPQGRNMRRYPLFARSLGRNPDRICVNDPPVRVEVEGFRKKTLVFKGLSEYQNRRLKTTHGAHERAGVLKTINRRLTLNVGFEVEWWCYEGD